jgi:N-acetyl-alpha-D-glucosaminyl L-malate synthase BshA
MYSIGIVCYPTYGGSGVVATELGKGLADRGHQVHFISYREPFRLDAFHPNIFYHEVNVVNYALFEHSPYLLSLAGKLVDVVKFSDLDLIHAHYAIPHASSAIMARQILERKGRYTPIVTTLHGTDVGLIGKDPLMEPLVTFAIDESDGVTAVSAALRQETYDTFDTHKSIDVIPNFVDTSRFQRRKKDHFRKAIAPNDEFILVHASNFRRLKRVDNVIRIFDRILQTKPAKLLLLGDGPERQKAEQQCRELGICDHIRFLGKQEAVEEIFSIADLFIMPSESESFGLAALEAMACGVPVISSNVGGLPEVVIDGITGFTRNSDDIEGMAEAAYTLLDEPELLAKFREAGIREATDVYSLEAVIPQYEAHYAAVLEGAKRRDALGTLS